MVPILLLLSFRPLGIEVGVNDCLAFLFKRLHFTPDGLIDTERSRTLCARPFRV